jgi:hypothetical protein
VIQRAHDYIHLVRRWRAVAKQAGLKLTPFAAAGDFDVFVLRTPCTGRGVYISAGIHGDEAGATEGLIAWAEKHIAELPRLSFTIFPCLNPWGLSLNLRTNEVGIDLNRCFSRDDVPVISALRQEIANERYTLSVNLHEDYDGQGIYLYEVQREEPGWGRPMLTAASRFISIDPRTRIDISIANNGLIRRRFDKLRHIKLGGLPEAVFLHREYAQRAITFETPSEFALEKRIAAHVALIEAGVKRLK